MKLEQANTMTPQQLLDYGVQKIVEQGDRCVGDDGLDSCLYGDGRGKHCLVGWCLDPDNSVLMGVEGDVYALVGEDDVPLPIAQNVQLFSTAQSFHDSQLRMRRAELAGDLRNLFKIDTSAPHWQRWIDMGEDE